MALGIGFFFVSQRIAGGLEKACGLRSARPRPHSCSRPDWCCEHATGSTVRRSRRSLLASQARTRPCSRGCPLRSRTGRTRASARRADRCGWHNGRNSLALAGHRWHRAAGAALAPGLQALDTDLTWESVTFATIVLMATAIATVPRSCCSCQCARFAVKPAVPSLPRRRSAARRAPLLPPVPIPHRSSPPPIPPTESPPSFSCLHSSPHLPSHTLHSPLIPTSPSFLLSPLFLPFTPPLSLHLHHPSSPLSITLPHSISSYLLQF